MPIEIQVAPPGITISQERTFMVTNQSGEINPNSDTVVYAIDTRFISFYRLYINRQPWKLVNASQLSFFAARWYLTNTQINTEGGEFAENTIGLTIDRIVEEGIHEDFYVVNYTGKKISFLLELALRSDFADIFEVRSRQFIQRGRMETRWDEQKLRLRTVYQNQDFHRGVTYGVANTSVPVGLPTGLIPTNS